MDFLVEQWLPIVLSAVFVFIASSIIHMVLPIHANDHKRLPDEEEVLAAIRSKSPGPGTYMMPHCGSMKEMGSSEFIAKQNQGPVGFMTLMPNGTPSMGKCLAQWFVYCAVVSVFVAYIASFALLDGVHDYLTIFRLTGTVAFLGYGLGACLESIFKGIPWIVSLKFTFDGLVYALVTAGTFGWLWTSV